MVSDTLPFETSASGSSELPTGITTDITTDITINSSPTLMMITDRTINSSPTSMVTIDTTTNSATANSATTNSATTYSAITNSATANNATTNSATTNSATTNNATTNSATTNNATTATTVKTTTGTRCNETHPIESNGTCVTRQAAIIIIVDILKDGTANASTIAGALSEYIDLITNSTIPSNPNNTLSISEIDDLVENLNGVNVIINTNSSFIMAKPPNDSDTTITLGASFKPVIGGQIVTNLNKSNMTNSHVSAAAIVSEGSLLGVTSLNMLIIDKPSAYENADNSTNKKLASSVIVVGKQPNTTSNALNISLYFKILPEYKPNISVIYLCAFFDTSNLKWNESGCTDPQYNQIHDRYECTCNHFTTFALIWLPKTSIPNYLTAQDITSLIFLSISILSFIAIIIHSLIIRFSNPMMSLRPLDLLPLISSATTTILFIFYIALTMTVYTQTTSQNGSQCFTSASVLMFFVYFFLIFMFCAKTSVGYFNYLRFVHLFPEPSYRKLLILLIISFFISITLTSFAAGFNSNSSYNITEIYGNKICWFTRNVIYYFMTIPACIFLLLNFITIILVGKRIINHIQNATSQHQSYERMKRCIIVLLSSCVTQGIGWLFGPFISIANPSAGEILTWFFVVFNGLEGVWSILLYLIIRSQRMDEQIRYNAYKKLTETTAISLTKSGKEHRNGFNNILTRRSRKNFRNTRKELLISTKL